MPTRIEPWRVPAYRAHQAAIVLYLLWRITALAQIKGVAEGALSAISVLAEAALVIASIRVMNVMTADKQRHAEADVHACWWERLGGSPPLVDLLIPSFNEARPIVERAIVGALNQAYPRLRVWVLDDGDRAWLEQLCSEVGVGYLRREQHQGGKAGNLNAALVRLQMLAEPPELIAVADADFVLQPQFLQRTIALLHDATVGLVQTPQFFYNLDNFQRSLAAGTIVPDALRFSHDVLLPGRDAADGAYCVGTSFVVRAQALRDLGGFPEESLQDDIWFSFRLRQAGWRIVYLNELLSFGVATEGLGEYLTQRARWALGYAQIVRLQWRVRGQGRTLWKRAQAAEGYLRFIYTALARVVFCSVPVLYWWSGVLPVRGSTVIILSCALPMLLIHRVFLAYASHGRQLPFYWDASSLVAAGAMGRGALRGFLRPGDCVFRVTDKGATLGRVRLHWRTLAWVGALIALLGTGAATASRAARASPEFGAMLVWTLAAMLVLILSAFFCVESPERRGEPRFSARGQRALLRSLNGRPPLSVSLIDISTGGVRLSCRDCRLEPGSWFALELPSDRAQLRAQVIRHDDTDADTGVLRFALSPEEQRRLIANVYSTRYVRPIQQGSLVALANGMVLRLIGRTAHPPRLTPGA